MDHDHNPLPQPKHLLAESEEIKLGSGHGSDQVHLALTGRVGEMRVMFVSGDGRERFVRYGLDSGRMGRVVGSRVGRYDREDMCDAPANSSLGWRDPGFIHDGIMVDLEPGKRYFYEVGSDADGWSKTFTFVSPDDNSGETIAFLYGDMGTTTPYHTHIRTQDESISTIKWIARDIEALGSKQYDFLKKDLESVDRVKTPFVVFQGHRPMYTTSKEERDRPIREKMLEHLEPLLVDNKVTMALWGHVHRYERFCPIKNYTCGSGPVHVVIGMAGAEWQPTWKPRSNHPDMPVFPQPARSIYRGGEFGYTRLTANKERLTLTYIGNHDGEVHDVVEIMASGEVVSGKITNVIANDGTDKKNVKGTGTKRSSVLWYVKGVGVLLSSLIVGYILGLMSRAKKEVVTNKEWTPVKTSESEEA
nr:probable inactive purple acid phosphatase 2 [Tanacetum cinerariifolium]